jgi:type II secretory pathway component PulK
MTAMEPPALRKPPIVVRGPGRREPGVPCARRSADRGVAILMVILVAAAVLAVAAPFALSMHLYMRSARHYRDSVRALLAAEGAIAHAVSVLKRTEYEAEKLGKYGPPWNTPEYDTEAEFAAEVAFTQVARAEIDRLGVSFNDPFGVIWSARVEDEQGKINLISVPPEMLANIIGSATLAEELTPAG